MNNSIEFVLKLKNMMGGELSKLSSTSQSTFTKMSKHADLVNQRNKVLGSTINEVGRQHAKVEETIKNSTIPAKLAQARKELAELWRAERGGGRGIGVGSSSGSGIGIGGVAVGSVLGSVVTRGLEMITAGAVSVITAAFQKQTDIQGLTTFLGEKGAAQAYKNIQKDAEATPFDTAALLQVNRSLISAGENAVKARSTSLDLANAVAAVGGGNAELSRMASNLQQIKTLGKANAMDIKQFGIAGINIYAMLAKSTGKTIDQVKEMEVTYEQLQQALAMSRASGGMYEGALEAQSKTIGAKYNTMKEKFMNLAVDAFLAFEPLLIRVLDIGSQMADFLGPVIQRAQPYIDYIIDGFSYVYNMITGASTATGGWSDYLVIAKDLISKVWVFVKNIGMQLWQYVSSVAEFVKNSALLKDVWRFIGWVMEKIFGIISWMLKSIIWLWENIIKPILTAVEAVYKWIKGDDGKSIAITATKKTVGLPKKSDSSIFENTKLATSNETAGKSAGESVVGGGPKTINITVGKFFDNLQFTTMNNQESAQELEKLMMEVLARVVYNGSKLV